MRPQTLAEPCGLAERAAATSGTLVSLNEVGVRFGPVRALAGVSLALAAGERVALVGANGCGKSTLLRVLHGLVEPDEGQVHLSLGVRQAMLFQRPHMLRTTAQNNVALALWLRRTPWREAQARALQALQRVGLAEVVGRNARMLSGGQQQRLALARAWALAPEVLLLDEPTASLDPHAKHEVEALMQAFARGEEGARPMTLIFASHNLGQVKRLASRVLYLEKGRLLADLPVARFFDRALLPALCPEADQFVKGETG